MLRIPNDPDFVSFIKEMRRSGASAQSIAAALNWSPWANVDGRRWHPRQVEQICSGGVDAVVSDAVDLDRAPASCDCPFHRRLQLLQAIRGWQPFDRDAAELIASHMAAGESARTVAARLNHQKIAAPTGRAWSARLVAAIDYLGRTEGDVAEVSREVVAA